MAQILVGAEHLRFRRGNASQPFATHMRYDEIAGDPKHAKKMEILTFPYKAAELCKTSRGIGILKHTVKFLQSASYFVGSVISWRDGSSLAFYRTAHTRRRWTIDCKRVFYLHVKGSKRLQGTEGERSKGAATFRSNLDRQVPGKASPAGSLPLVPASLVGTFHLRTVALPPSCHLHTSPFFWRGNIEYALSTHLCDPT